MVREPVRRTRVDSRDVAGAVLGLMHSYPSLFALAGLASLVAGATITRVCSVP
jgi:hypothetical protein